MDDNSTESQVNEFAGRIRAVRNRTGLSRAKFARFLGLERNTIGDWERGVKRPSPAMFGLLYKEFGEDVLPRPSPEIFGENLRFHRLKLGLSMERVGVLYGKGKNWWGPLETGRRDPNATERFFLERLLHYGEVRKELLRAT